MGQHRASLAFIGPVNATPAKDTAGLGFINLNHSKGGLSTALHEDTKKNSLSIKPLFFKFSNLDMNMVVHLWMERIEIQCKELETSQGTFQDLNAPNRWPHS